MGALKIREAQFEPFDHKSIHAPAQTDCDEEISYEQLDALAKQVAAEIDSDEWTIVDGPAW